MNTGVIVPFGSYNSDLTKPVPYDFAIPSYERALSVNTMTEVVDRNWALHLWRIIGSITVIGEVSNWATSLGGFTGGTPDPVPVSFTMLFDEPPLQPEPTPQPNFAVIERDNLVTFGVPAIVHSAASTTVFPLARLAAEPHDPVGGAEIRGTATVTLSISPYFAYSGGHTSVFPVVFASISAGYGFVRDDIMLEEGGNLAMEPIGGSFPYGPELLNFAGQLTIEDGTSSPVKEWGVLTLNNNVGAVSSVVSFTVRCESRFTPRLNT